MKSQIFRIKPPYETVKSVLNAFGLESFNDCHTFTKNDLKKIQTLENIINMTTDIKNYYYPCKSKLYLSNLNDKNVITILRHFAKLHNVNLVSNEKYIDGKKYIVYHLEKSSNYLNYEKDTKFNSNDNKVNMEYIEKIDDTVNKKNNVVISFN